MTFDSLKHAIAWVEIQAKFKPKADLDRMKQAVHQLALSFDSIKKVHIAGTNGKGSVASYISHVLLHAGYRVGTYTSPYLVKFNERIRLDMMPIEDALLLDYLNWVYAFNLAFSKSYGEPLSFFELITLVGFKAFYDQKVDYMVIEVGLGGLYDATNVLNYDVSLITSIGFDHMKQLGNTLESIAFNKLGILKEGNHLITTVDSSLHAYFNAYLNHKNITYAFLTEDDVDVLSHHPIRFIYQNELYELPLLGSFQVLNGLLAIEAIRYLEPKMDQNVLKEGLMQAKWAGRMEKIRDQFYLDGAHNTHAMEALKASIQTSLKGKRVHVLFAALSDKDIDGMLTVLKDDVYSITLTSFPDPRWLPYPQTVYPFVEDPFMAIRDLLSRFEKDDILIATGSLHFVGYLKGNDQL